jgi:HYR domain-containing protein
MNRIRFIARFAVPALVLFWSCTIPSFADTEHVIATGVTAYLDLDLKSDNEAGVAYDYFDSFNGRQLTRVRTAGGYQKDLGVGASYAGGYFLGPHFAFSPDGDEPSLVYHVFSPLMPSSVRKLQFEGSNSTTISDRARRDMVFAFDADGRPHVVYDVFNANFDYERWQATWDGSQWTSSQIEAPPLRVELAKWSMATDPRGGGVYAAYVVRPGGFTTPATRTEFILTRFAATGAVLGRRVVDSGGERDVPGEVSSMVVDAQGKVHIAYTFEDDQRGTWLLKYFAGDLTGGTVETIEQDFWPADFHTGVALALDTAGQPYIAYTVIDQTTYEMRLRVIQRDGSGNWTALAPLTQSAGVLDVDMAIGTDNVLQAAYMDLSDESIKLVQRPLAAGCKLNVAPVLRQDDTRWGAAPYDHRPTTIGRKGCALTSLTMAFNFAANTTLDPYWLNGFMSNPTHGDFGEDGGVLFGKTVRDVSHYFRGNAAKQFEWQGRTISSRLDPTAAEREVEEAVCTQGYPEIVGVKLRLDAKLGVLVPNHYVLVTGKEGNRFTIIDPLDPSVTYLDQYYADNTAKNPYRGGFITRGYVKDPPVSSGIDVHSATANLMLIDPLGRAAGLDLGSGEEVEEIPGAVHYLDALEDDETGELPERASQLIEITAPPEGTYRLLATALQDGPFQIILQAYSEDDSEQPPLILQGQAAAGESLVYEIEFSAAPGAAPQAVRCEVRLSAPPAVSTATGSGASTCGTVISDEALGQPAASATCSSVEVSRQGVPAGNLFPVGTTTITYTAEDELGLTASAAQQVKVTDGTPPLLAVPADVDTRNDPGTAFAILNPGEATATDNCVGRSLTAMRDDALALSAPYPIGATAIIWTATDDAGNSASGRQTVVVRDVEKPVLSGLAVDKPVLGPPNHQMIDVTVGYQVKDNSATAPACTLSVASNEPVNGTGDGDTAPDWIVLDAHRLRLRAERSGGGKGRLYTVTLACADAAGNAASGRVTVSVPKSQKTDR